MTLEHTRELNLAFIVMQLTTDGKVNLKGSPSKNLLYYNYKHNIVTLADNALVTFRSLFIVHFSLFTEGGKAGKQAVYCKVPTCTVDIIRGYANAINGDGRDLLVGLQPTKTHAELDSSAVIFETNISPVNSAARSVINQYSFLGVLP